MMDFRRAKLDRIYKVMKEQNINGFVFGNWDNIRYATGFRWIPVIQSKVDPVFFSCVLPYNNEPLLIVSEGDFSRAKTDYGLPDVRRYGINGPSLVEATVKAITDYNLQSQVIAIDDHYFPSSIYQEIVREIPSAKLVSSHEPMSKARSVKLPQEIEYLQKAAIITDASIRSSFDEAKIGVTESELAAKAYYEALHEGAEAVVNVIAASGQNSGSSHYQRFPTEKGLDLGDFLLFDMGVIYEGYSSDITRTMVVGEPSRVQREIFSFVLEAFNEGMKVIRPGVEAWRIDERMRGIITEAGYGNSYDMTVWPAHGIGLSHFEQPFISSKPSFKTDVKLEAGMVLALEPGIYTKEGGVRMEEMIAVTENGWRRLSSWDLTGYPPNVD